MPSPPRSRPITGHSSAEGHVERLPDVAAELTRLRVDVIVTEATPTTHAARQTTTTIPIVMVGTGDPVASGFVASLARPGGNITGQSYLGPELSGKRLELLKEAVPGLSRVAVLWNPANPVGAPSLKETRTAGETLALKLQNLEARDASEFEGAVAMMRKGRAQALCVLPGFLFFVEPRQLVDLVAKHRLPAIYPSREWVDEGGLMSYGPSGLGLWRRAAYYVDRILKGTRPADLPVEQPTTFELVVNMKTAKALGLAIPPSILIRADQVIK